MRLKSILVAGILLSTPMVGCSSDRATSGELGASEQAVLSGSTFEGNDGNLVLDSDAGAAEDWVNAPHRAIGTDTPSGQNDDSFGEGTKEDDTDVTVVTGTIPPNKNDLVRFYSAFEKSGSSVFLYLAWVRAVNIGAANIDFELNQLSQPSFKITPPAKTAKVTLVRSVGDLLISYSFGGSGTPSFQARKWITSGTCDNGQAATSAGCWGAASTLSSAAAEGQVNSTAVADVTQPGSPSLAAGTFGEASINLTLANLVASGSCVAFASGFAKAKASPSDSGITSALKDVIAPIAVNVNTCTGSATASCELAVNSTGATSCTATDPFTATVTAHISNTSGAPFPAGTTVTVSDGTNSNTVSVNTDGGTTDVPITFTTNSLSFDETLTAQLNFPDGSTQSVTITPNPVTCSHTLSLGLTVDKSCTVGLTTSGACGFEVDFSGTVTNTSEVALDVTITDDQPTAGTAVKTACLAATGHTGASTTYSGHYSPSLTLVCAGPSDTVTASATAPDGTAVSGTHTASCTLCP